MADLEIPSGATPPYPAGVTPAHARRQAGAVLLLFYAIVYGAGLVIGPHRRLASALPSTLLLATGMLAFTALVIRHDADWRRSLGLSAFRLGAVTGWSVVGFFAAYIFNIAASAVYLSLSGGLEALAQRRIAQFGSLADLPVVVIAPLVLFVALWEEIVFRGFLLGRLRAALPEHGRAGGRLRRDVVAVLLTALCFGLGHAYQGPLGIVQTTVAGIALGTLAVWRQSIWPAIGAHLLIDGFGLFMLKALQHVFPIA